MCWVETHIHVTLSIHRMSGSVPGYVWNSSSLNLAEWLLGGDRKLKKKNPGVNIIQKNYIIFFLTLFMLAAYKSPPKKLDVKQIFVTYFKDFSEMRQHRVKRQIQTVWTQMFLCHLAAEDQVTKLLWKTVSSKAL